MCCIIALRDSARTPALFTDGARDNKKPSSELLHPPSTELQLLHLTGPNNYSRSGARNHKVSGSRVHAIGRS